jgi:hypothetical protein
VPVEWVVGPGARDCDRPDRATASVSRVERQTTGMDSDDSAAVADTDYCNLPAT